MQPVVIDPFGVARFRTNRLVRTLLDESTAHGCGLNALAARGDDFTAEEWEQLAQLIGYSVAGFADLSYASKAMIARADRAVRTTAR